MSEYDDRYGASNETSYYGQTNGSLKINPPRDWKILPEGQAIPDIHRTYLLLSNGQGIWCAPRRCRFPTTPENACISGMVRAWAVPR
ncbi:hypothetical protein LCGC14_1041240 [marine sediment metagenome]|uniref:Uncharacterized protein n=1 Tax=marine sediment metagenome TaxID=412755 RepID=A0A0F9Q9X2_9ZZZZ